MKTSVKSKKSAFEHLEVVISDVNSLISCNQDFIGFIIIALGIEFIGNFYDEKNFSDFGQSEIRFKNGLVNLFKNNWYKNNSDWMFKNFRGPLLHQYRPGNSILLTSYCKNKASLSLHLEYVDGKRIFVLEQLFEDFKAAVKKLKNESQKKSSSLNKEKINGDYMAIINIDPSFSSKIFGVPFDFSESSGTTKC